MSKYKVGDKVVFTVTGMNERGQYPKYILNYNFYLWKQGIDNYAEPLTTYTEPLEAKIRRQAAEITRLLAENKELKEDFEKSKRVNLNMGRCAGQKEAWELARKIAPTAGGLSSSELVEIFNSFLPRDILSENTYPEAAAKVEAWEKAKAKPQKTMMQDFLEKFPKAELNSQGTPYGICPSYLGYKTPKCNFGCVECWNRPLEQIGEEK